MPIYIPPLVKKIGISPIPTVLNDLADVIVSAPVSGDGLVWNGSYWISKNIATQDELNVAIAAENITNNNLQSQINATNSTAANLQLQINELVTGVNIVFCEEFTGDGSSSTTQLDGSITNGVFISGGWSAIEVANTLPSYVTDLDGKPIYTTNNFFTRTRIDVTNINSSGLVTLSGIPLNSQGYKIWYFYSLSSDDRLDNYYRDDFVAEMEQEIVGGTTLGTLVLLNTAAFNGILNGTHTTAQSAFDAIDDHTHPQYTLISVTAGISGDLQTQINSIAEESTVITSSGGSILVSQNGSLFNIEVASVPIQNHNLLSGLQGSGSDYYHLNATQFASISGGVDLSAYTPLSTTASISGGLQSQINSINVIAGSNITVVESPANTFTISTSGNGIDYVPYTGATANVDLGNNKLLTDAVQLDLTPVATPSSTKGLVSWNATEECANIGMGDVTLQVGLEDINLVYNNENSIIYNGQLVRICRQNVNGQIAVKLARADRDDYATVFGMATQDIPISGTGFVTSRGKVHDLNTSAYTEGAPLYLSDTVLGGWTTETSGFALSSHKNQIGYVGVSDISSGYIFVDINNEKINTTLSETENTIASGLTMSSGVYEYSGMTIATSASFTVPPLKGWIVENTGVYATNPQMTNVIFAGGTYPVTNILTDIATYVMISKTGVISQQVTYPTPEQRRDNIFLGKIAHTNKTSIGIINNTTDYSVSPFSALRDMFTPIAILNEGVTPYPDGANLSFNKSAGSLYGLGINWTVNNKNPNKVTFTGSTPVTFSLFTQTTPDTLNTTFIQPGYYDVAGIKTAIPTSGDGGGHRSTNFRIYQFITGVVVAQYGQTYYSSLANAIAAVQTESFIRYPSIPGAAVLIGVLSVRRSATVLNDATYAVFTPASIFGEATGGTAGISTTTLQQAYDNSTTPEIVTNSILDGVTFRRGSASDSDDVFQVQSGSGVNVFTINGLGDITTASISGNAGNLVAHDINGKLIDAGAKISDYTLLTTTASISGDLQTQINSINVVAGSNITVVESPANTFTISSSSSASGSGGFIPLEGTGITISPSGSNYVFSVNDYISKTETISISGNLQSQINGKANTSHTHTSVDITDFNEAVYDNIATNGMIVAGSNITLNYDDINNQLTINSAGTAGVSGVALLQGITSCTTASSVYTITHIPIDTNYSYPVVNLEVPTSGSNLFIQGITSRTASSFQVTLSETPNVSGYNILWHLPTSDANVIGTAVVNQQMTTLPSYTTSVSGNYTVTFTDTVVYADNNNTILLPASPSTNEHHWIVNTYGADITVDGNGKFIWIVGTNNATAILPEDSSIHLHYNSIKDKWYII